MHVSLAPDTRNRETLIPGWTARRGTLAPMSNQQWDGEQGPQTWPNVPQPQTSGSGWRRPESPESADQGWGQPASSQSAQDWAQPAWNPPGSDTPNSASWGQAQQTSHDWQQPTQGWSQPAAPQPAQEWAAQQPTQQWPHTPAQQGWNQATAWTQPPPAAQPVPVDRKPGPFDFSVRKLSLPGSAGLIFLLGSIGLVVEWFAGVIGAIVSVASGYVFAGGGFFQLLGGLGGLLFKILVLRVLVEIGVATSRLLGRAEQRGGDEKSEA